MSKTNFTKVEEALAEGMRRIEVGKLNEEAKAIQKTASSDPNAPTEQVGGASPSDADRQRRKQALKLVLKWLWKQDKNVYAKLKTNRKEVKRLLESPEELTDFDWDTIDLLFARAAQIKNELAQRSGIKDDEDLVNQQRTKHLTKRFNVSDKWLPLK